MESIAPNERLIVALDCQDRAEALALVEKVEGVVGFFKIGYELFVAEGPALVREVHERGHRVFLDLKIDDVDETVRRAVRRIAESGAVEFMTILGRRATARAAVMGRGSHPLKILQVTLLTSMSESDLAELFLVGPQAKFRTVEEYVLWRAEQSLANGCDGLIASGQNARMLRENVKREFILVCPGIRPADASTNEHKRAAGPRGTIADGADYLVVGRPIRDAADPRDAARRIIEDIEQGLADRVSHTAV